MKQGSVKWCNQSLRMWALERLNILYPFSNRSLILRNSSRLLKRVWVKVIEFLSKSLNSVIFTMSCWCLKKMFWVGNELFFSGWRGGRNYIEAYFEIFHDSVSKMDLDDIFSVPFILATDIIWIGNFSKQEVILKVIWPTFLFCRWMAYLEILSGLLNVAQQCASQHSRTSILVSCFPHYPSTFFLTRKDVPEAPKTWV